ncbi:hypothetical protein ACSZM1_15060 [Aeromonas veronii]
MNKNLELLGYKMEIAGLVIALLATFWQANFSGWWDTEKVEWQYLIQEENNQAILATLGNLASLQTIDEPEQKNKQAFDIQQDVRNARSRAIDMRQQRKARLDEQAKLFSHIGFALICISACLIIIGKFCVYKSVKGQANVN